MPRLESVEGGYIVVEELRLCLKGDIYPKKTENLIIYSFFAFEVDKITHPNYS